jgi:hypothetical protein
MRTGVVEVTVKLFFELDLPEDQAREVVENVDYSFDHELISHTEIVADNISDLNLDQ